MHFYHSRGRHALFQNYLCSQIIPIAMFCIVTMETDNVMYEERQFMVNTVMDVL